jgi:cell pole-organizing protein PopZ
MRHQGEPSVEEILESIKKVIARDNRDMMQAERRHRESVGMASPVQRTAIDGTAQDDAILDLGEAEQVAARPAEGLTTEGAARAMRDSLAALAMISEPGVPPQIVRSGETSLEGLTRELLKPMLARWLDENLPPMVERLVTAEIARIAGKKG